MSMRGTFPSKWINGEDPNEPPIQTWTYAAATTILRQSVRTHWEAPFLYLIEGAGRALLLDTGTGDVNVREAVDELLAAKGLDLIVAHTHSHTDHVGGDRFFEGRDHTNVVGHSPDAAMRAFEIDKPQNDNHHPFGSIDLGGRIVDVLFIPGHQASHLAFYDHGTQLLFTGDTLYPGRLTVDDWPAYRASIGRLVHFVREDRPITHVLGSHIEMQADGRELVHQTSTHPNEHRLELAETHLVDLFTTVTEMGSAPNDRRARESFVVVPLALPLSPPSASSR